MPRPAHFRCCETTMKLRSFFQSINEAPHHAGGVVMAEAIHPTQLVNVDTPAFRSWFGASKAVDGEGHPIVFFRGTTKNPRGDVAFGTRRSIPSFVASADIASIYAASYQDSMLGTPFGQEPAPPTFQRAAQVTPVFLSIQNPVDMRGLEMVDFEMGLFGLLKSDWSDWNAMQLALDIMYDLARLENKGVTFEYSLPDPPGAIEQGDWGNVREWLEEAFDEAQDEQWSGRAAELFTAVLAEIEVDAYAIVDTPSFKEWASGMGFDGVVHDDVFAQGAKYAQSLLGKGRPSGLDEEDMHVTWRPFEATQVKSIFNQGGWSQEPGSKMTDSTGGRTIHDMEPDEQQEVMTQVYREVRSVAAKYKANSRVAGQLYAEFADGTASAVGMKFTPGGRSDPDEVVAAWEAAGAPLPNTPELEAWLYQYAAGRVREAAYLHTHVDGRRTVNDKESMGPGWSTKKLRD